MVLLPQFGTHLSCFGRLEAIEKKISLSISYKKHSPMFSSALGNYFIILFILFHFYIILDFN